MTTMRIIRIIRGMLFMALPLCAAPSSHGQSIQGRVTAGFGGYYRIGKCMPVKITLENSGADLSGEISVHLSNSEFVQAVTLSAPSKKTYHFYLTPPKYFQELEVKLFSEGKLLKVFSAPVRHLSDDETLILKSSTLRAYPVENPLAKNKNIYLDPQDFPDAWFDYEAVNSIILDAAGISRLTSVQREALSRWTLLGGSVALDYAGQASSGPRALGLGYFGAVRRAPAEDLWNQPSLFDLDEEAFKALRIRDPLSPAGITAALGIFLLLYAAVTAGCLLMTRKAGPSGMWIYAALPAAAILFSLASPLTGRLAHSGDAAIRQYSIHHVFINSMDAFATYDLSLLFPRMGSCRIRPEIPSPYLVHSEGVKSADRIHYAFTGNGKPSLVFTMNMGARKLIGLSGFFSQSPFSILRAMDSVALINKSPSALKDCTLLRNGVATPLGAIPSGKEMRLPANQDVAGSQTFPAHQASSRMLARTISVYETETLAGSAGDCVICASDDVLPGLASSDITFAYSGSTAVIYHLGKPQETERGQVQ